VSAPNQTQPGPSTSGSPTQRGVARFLPILSRLPRYDRTWFDDLIAAVAVAALIVPKSLGYAGIAGVPIQNGLYAAAAGSLIYAVFGTSRQISTGPSSALAALAARALLATAASGAGPVEAARWAGARRRRSVGTVGRGSHPRKRARSGRCGSRGNGQPSDA
jgi:MFS superfamily sulfate permease-like transporter